MIVKFLKSNQAKGLKAVSYVMSKSKHKSYEPKVLQGDPKITDKIIKSLKYKQKATFGVLSFEESNIDEELKFKLMEDFEKVLLPGLERDTNYNILWVEHRDKGRLELNFIIPKVELVTGKSLNPFFDKNDRARINAWREIQNIKYGFSSPEDLSKAHTLSRHKDPRINELAEKLNEHIIKNLIDLDLKSRDDIVNYINSLPNVEAVIPKAKKQNYINVYFGQNKRAVKFKGGVYEASYSNGDVRAVIERARAAISAQEEKNGRDRVGKLQKKLEIEINKKISYLDSRFKQLNINNNINDNEPEKRDSRIIDRLYNEAKSIAEERKRIKEEKIRAAAEKAKAELERARIKQERAIIERARAKAERIKKRIANVQSIIRLRNSSDQARHNVEDDRRERLKKRVFTKIRRLYERKQLLNKEILDDYIKRSKIKHRILRERVKATAVRNFKNYKARLQVERARVREYVRARIAEHQEQLRERVREIARNNQISRERIREKRYKLRERIVANGRAIQTRNQAVRTRIRAARASADTIEARIKSIATATAKARERIRIARAKANEIRRTKRKVRYRGISR